MSKFHLLWILTLVVVLFWEWHNYAPLPQNTPHVANFEPQAILQGNSFFSISSPEFPHIQVLASKIVDCESGNNNNAVGKAGERGIAQFKQKTFEWMSELAGTNGDWLNEDDQWNLLLWALQNNLENHWTCFKMVK